MLLSYLFLLIAIAAVTRASTTCNVLDHGGVADGTTDIGPAITKTYADCVSKAKTSNPGDRVLLVPSGTYALKTSVKFDHANYFTIEINGDLNLIFDATLAGNMFLFDQCDYVVWKGTGAIYGNGNLWRPDGKLSTYPSRPRLVRFQNCNNADISGVTLYNSPMFHLVVIGNDNAIHDMKIIADHVGETDGIDVRGDNNHVYDVSVENGDECVTVKAPTNGFLAENIQCFYSAGCNIGSFGKKATGVFVQNVYYRNVTQENGDGGIVLKSYPGASGVVQNVTYVDFTFTSVAHPIKISDFWCPHETCPSTTGNLVWKDITFQRITGTGDDSDRPTIDLSCISGYECTGLSFEDVILTKENHVEVKVEISNACGSGLSSLPTC